MKPATIESECGEFDPVIWARQRTVLTSDEQSVYRLLRYYADVKSEIDLDAIPGMLASTFAKKHLGSHGKVSKTRLKEVLASLRQKGFIRYDEEAEG